MSDVQENTGLKRETFTFSGTAGEYFGIWIVNLLLTMITLGIYGAWAKVRRMRYFYANTHLDGHNFEYHASGKQIFIGRIIVFGFLIIYNIILTISPLLGIIPALVIFIALPWLINKAISFNARVSTYRNVQFGFEGSYGSAFKIFVLLPMIIPFIVGIGMYLHYASHSAGSFDHILPGMAEITDFHRYMIIYGSSLGFIIGIAGLLQMLLYPYLSKMSVEYIGNRLTYGSAPFSTLADTGTIYKNFGASVLVSFIPLILFGMAIANIGMDANVAAGNPPGPLAMILIMVAYLLIFVPFLFYRAGVRNIAYNGTKLDGKHQLVSNLSRRRFAFIQITNFMVVMITLGLMRPWAAIRLQKYMVDRTAIDVDGSLDTIVSANEPQGNVAASEYLDFDGIDFGF